MPIKTLAALGGKKAAETIYNIGNKPIIGWTVTKHRKNKTVTKSFQLNGWHVAAVGALIVGAFATGMLQWRKVIIKDAAGAEVGSYHVPTAGNNNDMFAWITGLPGKVAENVIRQDKNGTIKMTDAAALIIGGPIGYAINKWQPNPADWIYGSHSK